MTHLLTPILPNVRERDNSGRIQALSFLCAGSRIQSSQNLNLQKFNINSNQKKKIIKYRKKD
jgi:hypothetical protein